MEHSSRPLVGLKVVEPGTLIAGPFVSRICAELGAKVIKIESPGGGDPLRKRYKLYEGTSLWWFVQVRNKKSPTLNLKHAEGQVILKRLLDDAGILTENFCPGVLEKLGLDRDILRALNLRLVMVRLPGSGQIGPYKDQPGFGAAGESMGGLHYITGFEDRPPVRAGISTGDLIAALWGVIGMPMALRYREANSGEGQMVDVALHEVVFAMMESMVPEFDVFGFICERTGNIMSGITPFSIHVSVDGRHVQIGANSDAILRRFMQAISRDDLASDPRLASNDGRDTRRNELYGVIDRWVASQSLEEVSAVLARTEVPASRICPAEDMFRDPQFLARETFLPARLPGGKPFRMPGTVPKLSATPGSADWVGPELGEYTDALLAELGYGSEGIAALRRGGAIQTVRGALHRCSTGSAAPSPLSSQEEGIIRTLP